MSTLEQFIPRTHIAYFSMEIAIRSEMHTYAGGLGILAGDTARSCADLTLPVVFITLVSRQGYFRQQVSESGQQVEFPDPWDPSQWCEPLDAMIALPIERRQVWIRPWLYIHTCPHGHQIPILLLDSNVDQNSPADRTLTDNLYGGDEAYRLKQEIILGLGGIRMLRSLGFEIHTFHMNEGHAALLTLDLLNQYRVPTDRAAPGEVPDQIVDIRESCVFTTHTPVEAGHDRFSYDLVRRIMPDMVTLDELKPLAGRDRMNMTQLALNLSGYVNGVARRHALTTEHMFPGYHIRAVTNGIHVGTWAHKAFARLYHENFPHWQHEPEIFVRAMQLPDDEVWRCHLAAKADLIEYVKQVIDVSLDADLPIIGFARRMTGYKRPMLLFHDVDRLLKIASRYPFQVVMAGKAHPHDGEGKSAVQQINSIIKQLEGRLACVFLPDYDMDVAKAVVAGSDLWLNTPLPPMEASGTSGMKAALNGVINLSVLDGWWIEAWIEGVTGWAIGHDGDGDPGSHADALYRLLEETVLPLYREHPDRWRWMMKQSIGNIAYYFNSHRMMRRYASEAYLR